MNHSGSNGGSMKRTLMIFLIGGILTASQQIPFIEHSPVPLNPLAGRTLDAVEVLRITDDHIKVTFDNLSKLKIGPYGDIFVCDGSCVYRFNPRGEFKKRIEDPKGQTGLIATYFVTRDEVILQCMSPNRVLRFDYDATLLETIPSENVTFGDYVVEVHGHYYTFQTLVKVAQRLDKIGYFDVEIPLIEVSFDLKRTEEIYSFPIMSYNRESGPSPLEKFVVASQDNTFFICHKDSYEIVKFDLRLREKEKIFKRTNRTPAGSRYAQSPPDTKPPFRSRGEIRKMLIVDDKLWVLTSETLDNKQSRLIDIFDFDGHFLDSFYVQFPEFSFTQFDREMITSHDGYIYVVERGQDRYLSIAKYRMQERPLFTGPE